MGIFSRKKIGSDEFETLLRKIVLIITDIDLLKSKCAALNTNMVSIRGLINRKFGDYGDEEQDLNSPDGLDELRKLKDGDNKTGRTALGN